MNIQQCELEELNSEIARLLGWETRVSPFKEYDYSTGFHYRPGESFEPGEEYLPSDLPNYSTDRAEALKLLEYVKEKYDFECDVDEFDTYKIAAMCRDLLK